MNTTTSHERRAHVARMRHNFAMEGEHPDAFDAALQAAYVRGTATLADMLAHAHAYARTFSTSPAARIVSAS